MLRGRALAGIRDLGERPRLLETRQVSSDGYRRSLAVCVLSSKPLPPLPKVPAARHVRLPAPAERVDVAEVTWGAPLHQRHHLRGEQVVKAVQSNSTGPEAGLGRLELGGAARDLESENRFLVLTQFHAGDVAPRSDANLAEATQGVFQKPDDALSLLGGDRLHPPGVHSVGRAVLEVVSQPECTAQGDSLAETAGREGFQTRLRVFRNLLWTLRLAQFLPRQSGTAP